MELVFSSTIPYSLQQILQILAGPSVPGIMPVAKLLAAVGSATALPLPRWLSLLFPSPPAGSYPNVVIVAIGFLPFPVQTKLENGWDGGVARVQHHSSLEFSWEGSKEEKPVLRPSLPAMDPPHWTTEPSSLSCINPSTAQHILVQTDFYFCSRISEVELSGCRMWAPVILVPPRIQRCVDSPESGPSQEFYLLLWQKFVLTGISFFSSKLRIFPCEGCFFFPTILCISCYIKYIFSILFLFFLCIWLCETFYIANVCWVFTVFQALC